MTGDAAGTTRPAGEKYYPWLMIPQKEIKVNINEIVETLNALLKELNEMKASLTSLQEATRGLMTTIDMYVEGAKHHE